MNKAENALAKLKAYYGEDAFIVEMEAPFRALIGCILSQRTRDENASKAANALFAVASTAEQILVLDPESLKRLIRPSGYYNQKARYILGACRAIIERFEGETPRTREELLSLPGVGPKTADIVLSYGYGEACDRRRHAHTSDLEEARASPEKIQAHRGEGGARISAPTWRLDIR